MSLLFCASIFSQSIFNHEKRPQMKSPSFGLKSELKNAEAQKLPLVEEHYYVLSSGVFAFLEKAEYDFYDSELFKEGRNYMRDSEVATWQGSYYESYKYNASNEKSEYAYSDYGHALDKRELYSYNGSAQLIETIYQYYDGGVWYNSTREVMDYTLKTKVHYKWDVQSSAWVYNYTSSYEFDTEDRIIEEIILDKDYNGDEVITYHDHQRFVYQYTGDKMVLEQHYDKTSDDVWRLFWYLERDYTDGKLVSYESYRLKDDGQFELSWDETWEYDAAGNPENWQYRFLDTEDWFEAKSVLQYDLNEDANDYLFPPIEMDIAFVNKLVGFIHYKKEGSEFVNERNGYMYYEGEVPTSINKTSANDLKVLRVQDQISFDWKKADTGFFVKVYDVSGKQVYQSPLENNVPIHLNQMANGLYIYQLTSGYDSVSGKFVIK